MNSVDRLVLPGLATALALSGCAGLHGPAANTDRPRVVTKDYVEVQLTGSYIPVRVPKSPTARMAPTISPLAIITPEEAVRITAPSTFPMH
jgi:hypothetical protein